MVGAEGGNDDVPASHFDIHILGVGHKPLPKLCGLAKNYRHNEAGKKGSNGVLLMGMGPRRGAVFGRCPIKKPDHAPTARLLSAARLRSRRYRLLTDGQLAEPSVGSGRNLVSMSPFFSASPALPFPPDALCGAHHQSER